jgi:hypothetical protein
MGRRRDGRKTKANDFAFIKLTLRFSLSFAVASDLHSNAACAGDDLQGLVKRLCRVLEE